MSYVVAQKNLLSPDLMQLISAATGFDEDTQEFISFETYVWNTIMHYECPSIDKNNIKARLFGFVEKFRNHAHYFPQKAKNLEMLIERCLEINCYEDDVLWNLLHLLLLLSKHPTEAIDDDLPLKFPLYKAEPKEEPFDWESYLKEGLPDYRFPSSEDDSLSEEEDSDLRSTKEALTHASREILRQRQFSSLGMGNTSDLSATLVPFHLSSHSVDVTLSNKNPILDTRTIDETNSETVRERGVSKEELKAALITKDCYRRTHPNWWTDPLFRELPKSKMPVSNACFSWEQKMSSRGVEAGETRVLSEAKALKELIYSLYHPQSYFILVKTSEGYKPREKVSISSTNPVDFYNTISEMCPYLSIIEDINKFIEVVDESSIGVNICSSVPYTYIAYAGALKHMMNLFRNFLCIVEAYITKQDNIYMISYLMTEIRPWLKHLRYIYNIHIKAVVQNWKNVENWICASRLLAVLYDALECGNGWEKLELTVIFIKSLRPYMEILDTWLLHSKYNDYQEEFLIKRPSKMICEGNLLVHDYMAHLSDLNLTNSLFLDNFVYYSIRACSSVDFQIILQTDFFDKPVVESLHPFYVEFIRSFVDEIQEEGSMTEDSCIPYLKYVKHKYESLNTFVIPDQNPLNAEMGNNEEIVPSPNGWIGSNLVVSDYNFLGAFKSFINPKDAKDLYSQSDFFKISDYLDKLEKIGLDSTDVARSLKEHFIFVINDRMQPKGFARDTLLYDYKLLDHLAVLKSVYLCLDGVKMSIFSKSLFSKVLVNGLKTISWTNELRDLLYKDYPFYYSNFIVVLPSKKLNFKKVIINADSSYPDFIEYSHQILINYLLEPPLNLVITTDSLEKYNELFSFLLQTKWAMSCLCNLSFRDLLNEDKGELSARLKSLRMFLLHNVSTLEKYFVSINSEDFDSEITHVCSVARDIHVIAYAHDKIINQRRKHCFLIGSPVIYSCIQTIFGLCQVFSSLWKLSFHKNLEIKVSSELSNFELKYQDCTSQLADSLIQLGKDHIFKNNVNFGYLCDELFNNMPGDW